MIVEELVGVLTDVRRGRVPNMRPLEDALRDYAIHTRDPELTWALAEGVRFEPAGIESKADVLDADEVAWDREAAVHMATRMIWLSLLMPAGMQEDVFRFIPEELEDLAPTPGYERLNQKAHTTLRGLMRAVEGTSKLPEPALRLLADMIGEDQLEPLARHFGWPERDQDVDEELKDATARISELEEQLAQAQEQLTMARAQLADAQAEIQAQAQLAPPAPEPPTLDQACEAILAQLQDVEAHGLDWPAQEDELVEAVSGLLLRFQASSNQVLAALTRHPGLFHAMRGA